MNRLDFFGLYVGISRVHESENMRILLPQDVGNYFSHIKNLKCDSSLRR